MGRIGIGEELGELKGDYLGIWEGLLLFLVLLLLLMAVVPVVVVVVGFRFWVRVAGFLLDYRCFWHRMHPSQTHQCWLRREESLIKDRKHWRRRDEATMAF